MAPAPRNPTRIGWIFCGPRRSTIETEIFRWAVTRTDINTAAALAVVQMVAVAALVLVNGVLSQRATARERLVGDRALPIGTTRDRAVVAGSIDSPSLFFSMTRAGIIVPSPSTIETSPLGLFSILAVR